MVYTKKAMAGAILLGVVLGVLLVALVGCGKAMEPFNDANVSGQDKGPAEVINMPDGFSNIASKCNHGNRVYTAYHANSPYAAVAVVPNDPSCAQ